MQAQLRNKGLTRNVTVPLSAGLLTDTNACFDALTAYREGAIAPIIERFAAAAFAAVDNGRVLAGDLRAIRAGWEDHIAARRGALAWRLADVLVRHPVVNASFLAAELGVERRNTYRAIVPLVEAGVLVETTDNKRNRLWRAPEVLEALDGFAARAGHRSRAR